MTTGNEPYGVLLMTYGSPASLGSIYLPSAAAPGGQVPLSALAEVFAPVRRICSS